jgi:hypothetical protein
MVNVMRPGRPGRTLARAATAAAAAVAAAVAAAAVVAAADAMSSILRTNHRIRRGRGDRLDRVCTAVADLELPPVVFKTCPWRPRSLVETGLRQWLRCCAPALRDRRAIGMPSRAVDEAWHGLILCTAEYSAFCTKAYGKFLHHYPTDGVPTEVLALRDPMDEQLRRTVIAWSLVAKPGEQCVLWDVDEQVGVDQPWGLPLARVAEIHTAVTRLNAAEIAREERQ